MTMQLPLHSYILCGGIGSRLWPLSRKDKPKQFHALTSEHSLLEETIMRMALAGDGRISVISSQSNADLLKQSLKSIDQSSVGCLFEPVGRNTAAAAAIATLDVLKHEQDGLVLVVSSDALISDNEAFRRDVDSARKRAENGHLVVFGVEATRPETGYGYIEAANSDQISDVISFKEKPSQKVAEGYLNEGRYLWNAGIFLFKASKMKEHFETYSPEIWRRSSEAFALSSATGTTVSLPLEPYQSIPSQPFDIAIVEKATPVSVVRAGFGWSDVGSWQSLHEVGSKDAAGNLLRGDVIAVDCSNSYFHSTGPLLSAAGLQDIAIIATADAVFATPLDESQNVKNVLESVESAGRSESSTTSHYEPQATMLPSEYLSWLTESAVPLWIEKGVDREHGGFHESLDQSGQSMFANKRLRTMARQTYCFATASILDWHSDAKQVADYGCDYLINCIAAADGLFPRLHDKTGKPIDHTQDLYDVSFVLLAAATCYRDGNERGRELGDLAMRKLEEDFHIAAGLGYGETSDDIGGSSTLPRRANPHMHLFEALLVWYEATQDPLAAQRCLELHALFADRISGRGRSLIVEFFDQDFMPHQDKELQYAETGHQFEWVWLLCECDRILKTDSTDLSRSLYSVAETFGINLKTNLPYQYINNSFQPVGDSVRSWSQIERIKACLALGGRTTGDDKLKLKRGLGALRKHHLNHDLPGLWNDEVNFDGTIISNHIPASILYHLVSLGWALSSDEV